MHGRDRGVYALPLVRARQEQAAPARDDLAHGVLLASFLGRLVVVLTEDERNLEVEHFVPEVAQCEHGEDEVNVLHAAGAVAPSVESAEERTERFQANEHPGVARVPIGASEAHRIAVLTAREARTDDPNRWVVGCSVEHGLDVCVRELRLDRDGEQESELLLPLNALPDVRDLHGLDRHVERVRPGVPLVHLDHLDTRVEHERVEVSPRRAFVLRRVHNDDDPTQPDRQQVTHLLGDVLVVVGSDDRGGRIEFAVQFLPPFKSGTKQKKPVLCAHLRRLEQANIL